MTTADAGDVAQAKAGVVCSREKVCRAMLPKVRAAAQHMAGDLDQDDMVQAGMLGVLKAIERYEPGHGASFSTYALWWVRHYMQLYRRNEAACGITGLNVRRAIHARKGSGGKAGGVAGKSKDPRWQAGGQGTACRSEAERDRLRDRPETLTPPLAAMIGVGAGGETDMVAAVDARKRSAEIDAALAQLPARERRVLEGRFWEERSLRDLATELKCTAEVVRRVERKALIRLRGLLSA